MSLLRFLHRFAGNLWYYYVERRQRGYGRLPLDAALSIAYSHTTHFKDQLARCQNPAWGGEAKEFYD